MALVEEVTGGLTETERRRLLKIADGLSAEEIAAGENCRREAVVQTVARMIQKNSYCQISSQYGVLRRRKNQYE